MFELALNYERIRNKNNFLKNDINFCAFIFKKKMFYRKTNFMPYDETCF